MASDDAAGIDAALRRSLGERSASLDDVERWLTAAESGGEFAVEERPLHELDGWVVDDDTHDITHASGRFFSIRGADASITYDGHQTRWQQPIIVQPDVGVLGLVAASVDGVLRFLVQAKMEPGNRRLVQVSPTVQATASNFERIHQGSATPYLEHFQRTDDTGHLATLVDHPQTEQASRYLRKRNRNVVVVVDRDHLATADERFRWLTLADLVALAEGDDLLHMDTRSVLGSLPLTHGPSPAAADAAAAADITRWQAALAQRAQVRTEIVPLRDVAGWSLADGRVTGAEPAPFAVLGVRVRASHREVSAWDQPLVHGGPGAGATLLVQRRDGVLRVLVAAATGLGVRDGVELGPSLSRWPAGEREVVLDQHTGELADAAARGTTRFDNSLPEEGGRFFQTSTWHRIVELDETDELPERDERRWLDLAQLRAVGGTTSLLNMELRSLLACLPVDLRSAP